MNCISQEFWRKRLEEREEKYDEACREAITKEEKISALIPFIEQRVIFKHWESSDFNELIGDTCVRIKDKCLPNDLYPIAIEIILNSNEYEFPRLHISSSSFNDGITCFRAKDEYRRIFKDGKEIFNDN